VRSWRSERGALLAVVGLGLAAVALLGGCGNEKRDFREDRLNPLVRRVGEERAVLASVLRASRPGRARDGRALRSQLARLGAVMRRIAALEPPDGVEDRLERYTRANAALLAALRRFVDAFAGGASEGAQRTAARRTQTTLATANRAQRALQQALR